MYILSQYISYKVNQDVLQWAIKESQKNVAEIKDKYPKINDWIDGSAEPTLRQLENLANYLKIPFGYMFLQRPPKDDFLKAEFRSINNKAPHVSKNLKDTLLEMDSRQSWMSEYRKNLGWEMQMSVNEQLVRILHNVQKMFWKLIQNGLLCKTHMKRRIPFCEKN